jgi:hypothetical protein
MLRGKQTRAEHRAAIGLMICQRKNNGALTLRKNMYMWAVKEETCNTYKCAAYLTGDTSRLRYIAQPVNAVWGNSRCLL